MVAVGDWSELNSTDLPDYANQGGGGKLFCFSPSESAEGAKNRSGESLEL